MTKQTYRVLNVCSVNKLVTIAVFHAGVWVLEKEVYLTGKTSRGLISTRLAPLITTRTPIIIGHVMMVLTAVAGCGDGVADLTVLDNAVHRVSGVEGRYLTDHEIGIDFGLIIIHNSLRSVEVVCDV